MKISDLLSTKQPTVSFEVFPPKPDYPIETIFRTLDELKKLNPDFISVTYGAGGGNRERTVEIAAKVKQDYQIETLAHLTCVGHSKAEIERIVHSLSEKGIENILALRGDYPEDLPRRTGEFSYALDLIEFLRIKGDFSIGAAAYPEGHPETAHPEKELAFLKRKVEAGVDFLITQMIFDNTYLYAFLERLSKAGINCPVLVGVMPIFNVRQIKRISSLCGATIPPKLSSKLELYADSPEETEKIGIDFAVSQISDLLQNGVHGIHLYTMNKAKQAQKIMESLTPLQ
ncbi:MAG TPA: methylenetetrahydrofolate reductase [NAD(P)H] [Bacillota bacterium]